MRQYLLIPGPTPLPREVLEASSKQMLNHRGPEFGKILAEALAALRRVFMTRNTVIPFASSGTGGLEAAVVNLCSAGDTVIAVTGGNFGDRFAAIAQAFGVNVERVDVPWGEAVDPAAVRAALRRSPQAKAVLVTHSETSTGVRHDVGAIASFVRETPALMVVDAVSSLGAIELRTDEWGIDVVITGSQKALMAPPGLALVSVSDRAWAATKTATLPRFYWSFDRMKADLGETSASTPFTPAMSVVFALHAGLRLLEAEGIERRFERHRRVAAAVRAGVAALGLRLLPKPEHSSETVTAFWPPDGIAPNAILDAMRAKHGVVVAGGVGKLAGKIIRFGHLGWIEDDAILTGLRALETELRNAGADAGRGAEAAAREILVGAPA
jgi:aspartate aminotransferase-like enzyme